MQMTRRLFGTRWIFAFCFFVPTIGSSHVINGGFPPFTNELLFDWSIGSRSAASTMAGYYDDATGVFHAESQQDEWYVEDVKLLVLANLSLTAKLNGILLHEQPPLIRRHHFYLRPIPQPPVLPTWLSVAANPYSELSPEPCARIEPCSSGE